MNNFKSFSEYFEERDEEAGLGDIDAMPNEDEVLMKLAKLAISRHQERLLDFFSGLAKHDDDIKEVLGQFRDKRNNYFPKSNCNKTDNDDIVVPNVADTGGPV